MNVGVDMVISIDCDGVGMVFGFEIFVMLNNVMINLESLFVNY